jgi:hypothetical protein
MIKALQHYSITALQHYSITALQHYSITALQHYNITALQHYNITTLQHYNITTDETQPQPGSLESSKTLAAITTCADATYMFCSSTVYLQTNRA